MNIRVAYEGEVTWFDTLSLEDLPAPLPNGIRILSKSGKLGIDIQGIAGAIPLMDGSTLRIQPKIGNTNFFRLLFIAEGNQKELTREYDDFVSYSVTTSESIEQIAARQFLESVAEILRRSPINSRQKATITSTVARGQLVPVATALNVAKRLSNPVVSMAQVKTTQTPENAIISEAVYRAPLFLNEAERLKYASTATRWQNRFLRSVSISDDLETIDRKFAKNGYGGPRGYYQKALMLARVILGAHGFSISDSEHNVSGDALLINTADVFEKYLRRVVQLSHEAYGFVITKAGIDSTSLYVDGSFSLEPDILVEKAGTVALIADAKYKTPTSADHYQMYVYLKRYSANCGILICPNFNSTKVSVKEFLTPDRLVIRELHVPMSDLDRTEATLGSLVRDFSTSY